MRLQNCLIPIKYRMDFIFKDTIVKITLWKECKERLGFQVIKIRMKCTKTGENHKIMTFKTEVPGPLSPEEEQGCNEQGAQPAVLPGLLPLAVCWRPLNPAAVPGMR